MGPVMGKIVFSKWYLYFENRNSIAIFNFQNRLRLATIYIFYFQNTFKNYSANLKIVFQNS